MKKLLLVISLLMLSSILINMVYADDHDLSGQVYPITAVKEGMNFSETTSKVEIVLDKIEKSRERYWSLL